MSEKLIDIKTFNISSLCILNPVARNNGYGSKLIYDGYDFKFQLPLCIVSNLDENHLLVKFELSENFDYFQFFCSVNELIIKYLIRYSTNPTYSILKNTDGNQDDVRAAFKSTIFKIDTTNILIKLKVLKSTLYFDKTKREISGLEIKPGDKVVCMISPNPIVSDDISASQVWTCTQCLKFA